jgi:excisionase family DNA binding protein
VAGNRKSTVVIDGRMAYRQAEVARMVGVSRWTVGRWVETGELDTIKVPPNTILIPAESVRAFLSRHRVR